MVLQREWRSGGNELAGVRPWAAIGPDNFLYENLTRYPLTFRNFIFAVLDIELHLQRIIMRSIIEIPEVRLVRGTGIVCRETFDLGSMHLGSEVCRRSREAGISSNPPCLDAIYTSRQ